MEQQDSDYVISFDTLYTNNHIQMLKVLEHYLPSKQRNELPVLIKYMELQYTISHCKQYKRCESLCASSETALDIPSLLHDILCYCDESEKKKVQQFLELTQTMQMVEDMQRFSSMMPNGEGNDMALLQSMLSPEQMAMFEMFQDTKDTDTT
ncbi:MAG: hypothetical protein RRX92_05990 [Lachnospiraceae bacterium]